ncbi:hypothetical protein E2F48_04030 [Arthrobacter crusticola]|uniref:Uncharacterized protein n=1 Tax=Arthrobacter crusticola TaxID=2547960 RepID=A0A4R5TYS2_9MICC|nr:hypothetical protein [Arthrobacter crusticola]TDK26378.1 hypothetical protein E2F48_04030 [Arthrobacter crusticola]
MFLGITPSYFHSIDADPAAAAPLDLTLVCHRNHDSGVDQSSAALVHPEQAEGEPVEVSVVGGTGFIPSRFGNGISPVESALEDFFRNPASETLGAGWVSGLWRK